MIKIGMMLGERYEMLEKIGTGGMSDVYKAKCHKLNRYVAVKVLKQEFSENSNFVSKFRVEAQAAASLMHPNIVNVYDVGEDNGIHYIVMELVEGITLKKYIEKKARLSVKEAVSIAIQACMGIEAAHNNHIIHRDIKPQNIIISKEGKVKVTDFGIAKAATSNTITSNVMGSVHYTSPEQARGGYSDEKSDIYSMGITLFEMLTGRVPFNGDTTVAIAIKHIQEPMPSPRDYVPEIPVSVEQIVLKCTQKSPDRRYQSMNSLIEDLKKSLISPDEDFVRTVDPEATAATRTISRDDMEQIKKQSKKPSHTEEIRLKKNTAKPSAPPSRSGKKRTQAVYQPEPEDDEEEEEYESRMEKVTTVLAVIGAIIIGCVVIFLVGRAIGIFDFSSSTEDGTVKMIEVAGMTEDEAKQKLTKMGLEPSVEYVESDSVEEGLVIDSDVKKEPS
ncbi:MAG: Stk1 family PASTA domain-containing Ser/Thr kinase [Eisenbergiella sp.]